MASTVNRAGESEDSEVETEVNPVLAQPLESSARDRVEMDSGLSMDPFSGSTMTGASTRVEQVPLGWRLPLLGSLPVGRQIQILSIVLVVCLVAAAGLVFHDARTAGRLAAATSTVTTMQMLSQRMAKAAQQAVQGESRGFEQLATSRDRFDADLVRLRDGDDQTQQATGAAATVLDDVSGRWDAVSGDVELILSQKDNLLELRNNEETVASVAPLIQRLTQQLATLAATPREAYSVRTYVLQLDADVINYRFADASRTLSTEQPNPRVAFQLGKNVAKFREDLKALLSGSGILRGATINDPDALATVRSLEARFIPFAASVEGILANMQSLAGAKQASRNIFTASEGLLQLPGELVGIYAAQARQRVVIIGIAIAFGLLALACVILIGKVYLEDARARAAQSDREYRRNQEAIIRLLDEMQGLAEGNLTIRARVTDDITGTIADSVNFAVEELRTLVLGINEASVELNQATGEARGSRHSCSAPRSVRPQRSGPPRNRCSESPSR